MNDWLIRPAGAQLGKMTEIGSRRIFDSDQDLFRQAVRFIHPSSSLSLCISVSCCLFRHSLSLSSLAVSFVSRCLFRLSLSFLSLCISFSISVSVSLSVTLSLSISVTLSLSLYLTLSLSVSVSFCVLCLPLSRPQLLSRCPCLSLSLFV